jgi:hypothetical protein
MPPPEVNELGRHYIAIPSTTHHGDGRYERRGRDAAPFHDRTAEVGLAFDEGASRRRRRGRTVLAEARLLSFAKTASDSLKQ